MINVRQYLFVCCCASITGLSYLLSYTYIVIMNRFVDSTPFYISVGALAHWTICTVLSHFMFIVYERVRRDTLAASLVGTHTAMLLCLVVGAVYVDSTEATVTTTWIVMATVTEIIIKITMEMFQVATIRDWIIEVSNNDCNMLVRSNTWYYILAVTIPGLMTLGGNYLFVLGVSVTGIVLTLGASAILLQLLALTAIIFIIGPLQNNTNMALPPYSTFPPLDNVKYFFKQSAWELSLGLDVESLGLITFGLFMRLFLAEKGVTPYTITVVMCLQTGAAVLSALFYPMIRRQFNGGYVITICTAGKIIFSFIFLFVVFKGNYTAVMETEVVIITQDSIFIELQDTQPEDNMVMTVAIMGSSVLLAAFSQLDTLFSNQLIQESVSIPNRGRYAGVEFSFKYTFTLIKQVCIATLEIKTLFLVLLILTFGCEILKMFLTTKYVLREKVKTSIDNEYELEHRGLINK